MAQCRGSKKGKEDKKGKWASLSSLPFLLSIGNTSTPLRKGLVRCHGFAPWRFTLVATVARAFGSPVIPVVEAICCGFTQAHSVHSLRDQEVKAEIDGQD